MMIRPRVLHPTHVPFKYMTIEWRAWYIANMDALAAKQVCSAIAAVVRFTIDALTGLKRRGKR